MQLNANELTEALVYMFMFCQDAQAGIIQDMDMIASGEIDSTTTSKREEKYALVKCLSRKDKPIRPR